MANKIQEWIIILLRRVTNMLWLIRTYDLHAYSEVEKVYLPIKWFACKHYCDIQPIELLDNTAWSTDSSPLS